MLGCRASDTQQWFTYSRWPTALATSGSQPEPEGWQLHALPGLQPAQQHAHDGFRRASILHVVPSTPTWMRLRAFQVDCPCRTSTTRLRQTETEQWQLECCCT